MEGRLPEIISFLVDDYGSTLGEWKALEAWLVRVCFSETVNVPRT